MCLMVLLQKKEGLGDLTGFVDFSFSQAVLFVVVEEVHCAFQNSFFVILSCVLDAWRLPGLKSVLSQANKLQ